MCPDFTALHLLAIPAALHSTTVKISTLQSLTFSQLILRWIHSNKVLSPPLIEIALVRPPVTSKGPNGWPASLIFPDLPTAGAAVAPALSSPCSFFAHLHDSVYLTPVSYSPPQSILNNFRAFFFFFFWKCISSPFIWEFPKAPFSLGSPKISLFEALFPHGANV